MKSRAPSLMYLPLSPHQHSERCQRKKTQGLSKSPKPRDQIQRLQSPHSKEAESSPAEVTHKLALCPPVLITALKAAVVPTLYSEFCRCIPVPTNIVLSASSSDTTLQAGSVPSASGVVAGTESGQGDWNNIQQGKDKEATDPGQWCLRWLSLIL